MNTPKNIEFSLPIPANDAMEIVESKGIVALHNFLPVELREYALRELNIESSLVDDGDVSQKRNLNRPFSFEYSGIWQAPSASLAPPPLNVQGLAQHIAAYANRAEAVSWNPSEIVGHEYQQDDFLGNHLAYMGAIGHIAIATLDGVQDFHAKLDDGSTADVEMTPGTVLFIRGNQENGKVRPAHWVGRAKSHRIAVSVK